MPGQTKARVLVVDDHPDEQNQLRLTVGGDVELEILHPRDVDLESLAAANLVLVDYRLDSWPERDKVDEVALQPTNGLALTGILRAQSELPASEITTPKAFALHSGHLTDLGRGMSDERQEAVAARLREVEWVFPKAQSVSSVPVSQQIVSLADAVMALPNQWPQGDERSPRKLVEQLLRLPTRAAWASVAWEDIESCQPPTLDLSKASRGIAFIRWLLQSILPYPCFLLDWYWLAARLSVTHASLLQALAADGEIARALGAFRYDGILSSFVEDRWWRTGVDEFLWESTDGNPFNPGRLRGRLACLSDDILEPSRYVRPIVCLDKTLRPLPDQFAVEDAVRIQPDGWPHYAEQAWTSVQLASHDDFLRSIIVSTDRDRLR